MTTEQSREAAARRAQEARENSSTRKAQQVVRESASAIQEAVGNLSPTVAGSMGAPLDSTAGYSFVPGARPADLPMPGDAPGGRASRNDQSFVDKLMGDEMGGPKAPLPDDHDAILGGQPPAGPQAPQNAAVMKLQAPPEHPILTQLKLDLGVETIKTEDVTIGGHKWTLHVMSPGDVALAHAMTDQLSEFSSPSERMLIFRVAVAANAVRAIDGIPTYVVFGIQPPPGMVIADHLRPPRNVRALAVGKLYDFIQDDSRAQLGERLHAAYLDKVDKSGFVESYLDDPHSLRVRFRCEQPNCKHELYIVPRTIPGKLDIVLPFCQWHGTPMVVASKQEPESPLL